MANHKIPVSPPARLVDNRDWWWSGALLVTLLFWLSYTQFPLYSNFQTQYFFHGAARSDEIRLQDDILASTVDPWPLFTRFVQVVRLSHLEGLFSIVHLGLAAAYILGLVMIGRQAQLKAAPPLATALLAGFLILVHSEFIGDSTRFILGRNIWMGAYFGVANQGLLAVLLAPSVFGVLIVTSIAAFLAKRPYMAAILAGSAGAVHFLHTISAAVLILTYGWLLWRERHSFSTIALMVGMWAVIIVPTAVYSLTGFAATSPEMAALGNHYLVSVRMPNHSDIQKWFGAVTITQIIFVGVALWLVRRSPLIWLLGIPSAFAFAGTVAYVITDNPWFGVIQPWRLSTYVVPLCLAVIVAAVVRRIRWPKLTPLIMFTAVVVAAVYGVVTMLHQWHAHGLAQQELKDLVVDISLEPGGAVIVPIDLKDWRLSTGVPAVVDFKTVPYRDSELIDWYNRSTVVRQWYAEPTNCSALALLQRRYHARYVVWPRERAGALCEKVRLVNQTAHFQLLAIP